MLGTVSAFAYRHRETKKKKKKKEKKERKKERKMDHCKRNIVPRFGNHCCKRKTMRYVRIVETLQQ